MARAEILQAKDYLVNLASRSIGIDYYLESQRADKVAGMIGVEQSTREAGRLTGKLLTIMAVAFPAFMRMWMMESKIEKHPSQSRIQNLIKGAAVVGTVSIDTAPYALAILADPAFILGKPLLHAVSHLVADQVESKLDPESRLPKVPEGTYTYLEQLYSKFPDPTDRNFAVIKSEGETTIIRKEQVCNIGGSCMEITLIRRENVGPYLTTWVQGTHITRGDRVVNVFDLHRPDTEPNVPLTAEKLLHHLKSILPEFKTS